LSEKKSFESFSFLKALGEEDLSSAGQSDEELPKEDIFFFFKTKKNDSRTRSIVIKSIKRSEAQSHQQ
jgi:hypothetical protein